MEVDTHYHKATGTIPTINAYRHKIPIMGAATPASFLKVP